MDDVVVCQPIPSFWALRCYGLLETRVCLHWEALDFPAAHMLILRLLVSHPLRLFEPTRKHGSCQHLSTPTVYVESRQ